MTSREILISSDIHEVRVAILEDGRLAEYLIERANHRRLTGNIYQGRITTIVPGMEAAFVDIGLPKNAFLYVNDIGPFTRFGEAEKQMLELAEDEELNGVDAEDETVTASCNTIENGESIASPLLPPSISDLIKEGQEILVQVYKEPLGRKGCRVTTNHSLPGRYLVLLPMTDRIGVSRRIVDTELREAIRQRVRSIIDSPMGAIVRTAAEDASDEQLGRDYEQLRATWENILSLAQTAHAPALIHEDRGLIYRLVRDIFNDDTIRVWVDDDEIAQKIVKYAQLLAPSIVSMIERYDGDVELFEHRGIEAEISGLLSRKVWLSCGGYIVIDETEAFTAIDVNTGRYIGDCDLEQTVYRVNLEAAVEIARQIRLRDIGGIIVIDFIDMREEAHREALVERFRLALQRDRSRSQLFELSPLGLLQLTRRRIHSGITKLMTEPCPVCRGSGQVISMTTMSIRALRMAEWTAKGGIKEIRLRAHPRVATEVMEEHHDDLLQLEQNYNCSVYIIPDVNLPIDQIIEETL